MPLAVDRSHWSLLIVGAMLLVCLTVLIYYIAHDSVKSKVFSLYLLGFCILCVQVQQVSPDLTETHLLSLLWQFFRLLSTHDKLCIVRLTKVLTLLLIFCVL